MKIIKTQIKGLLVFKGEKFNDNRGYFREVLIEKTVKRKFKFNVVSMSKKNVIRGLHLQEREPQAKFISVVKGKIIDVAVDIRKNSRTYGKHFKIVLSDKNCTSLYIPEGFAHGFGGLEKENIVVYSCTNYRHKKGERGIRWNDKNLKINWKIKKPIISSKDKKNIPFEQFK
ncbi:MAG: dTDP-4-dehydrorhamnose 3,5-epimerase [Pelagibacteraceae bacterium TMED268]|nr:MAG: dTDP-4-dehydrorhamnose 3,5-epimerase [Pelagibacteraceae bacterium TMED268]|tara:strand:- start:4837 stop:5352 length:516 start_codon:yes stop_codon:yes gene_type:complete